MKATDDEIKQRLEEAAAKPGWARTIVAPEAALRIEIRVAGSLVLTSEGVYEFEQPGEWILLPMALWRRTLVRLRGAEARVTGKGDGGPRRLS